MRNKRIWLLVIVAALCSVLVLLPKGGNVEQNYEEPANENLLDGRNESSLDPSFTAQNESLIGKVWYNKSDNSPIVFVDGQNFVWYQDDQHDSDNALAGEYRFYYGREAYKVIEDRFENDSVPTESDLSSVMMLEVLSAKSNGEDIGEYPVEIVLFGHSDVDFSEFSYVEMKSLDQYFFSTFMIEAVDEQKLLEEVMKDVVYKENTDAWDTFEINLNGKTLSYPYSAFEIMSLGWKCSEIDGENGEAYLYQLEQDTIIEVIFADTVTDQISAFDMKNDGETKLILANGITWGATEAEVIGAFGEPDQVARGGINQKIYRYNKNNEQMELYIFTEDANYNKNAGLQQVSIHNFINQ